jgi:DNA-binding XRE family transcriptional regulator
MSGRDCGLIPPLTVERIDQIAEVCLAHNPATAPGSFVQGMMALWCGWTGQATLEPQTAVQTPDQNRCSSCLKEDVEFDAHYNEQGVCKASSSIGKRLRIERKRLGLTQEAIAIQLDVVKHTQGLYERDERHPNSLYLAQFDEIGGDVLFVLTGNRKQEQKS